MNEIEEKLKVGTVILLGKIYCEKHKINPNERVIVLIPGYFEYENGLSTETHESLSIREDDGEFSSINYLFGGDMENWYDNQILDVNKLYQEYEELKTKNNPKEGV